MSSYRGEISIPVRNESRHGWGDSSGSSTGTRSLKEKFAEERRKMEAEMENLKRRFHVGGSKGDFGRIDPVPRIRSPDFYDRDYKSSSSYYDSRNSTLNDSRRQQYGGDQYDSFVSPLGSSPTALQPFPSPLSADVAAKSFGKSPEWRFVETGPDGRKMVKLQFDMGAYHPDEIQVLVDNDYLKIRAKHEEAGPNKSSYREYNREFTLPSVIRSNQITSHLGRDGILTVEAPLPPDFDLRRNDLGFDLRVPVEYK